MQRLPRERQAAAVTLFVSFGLRIACLLRYRVDSDEPQHLHVVWAWTQHLLPYRDVFDNHMPLFHLLYAPVLQVLGERPTVILWMRLAVLPLYLVSVWTVGRVAAALFSERVALWTVALAGLGPVSFLCSLEFRADDLWMVWWFLAIWVAVTGRARAWRTAAVGVCLGLAVSVSLKTTLMLIAFAMAIVGRWVIMPHAGDRGLSRSAMWHHAAAFLLGFLPAPMLLAGGFAAGGAWQPFVYGTVQHNLLPGIGRWGQSPYERWLFLPATALVWGGGKLIVARSRDERRTGRRVFLWLLTGGYVAALFTLWPLHTREDFLPFEPLVLLWVVALMGRATTRGGLTAPCVLGVALLAVIAWRARPWIDAAHETTALLDDVLRLTGPRDCVLDRKGDVVYRCRPFFFGIEALTKARLARGLIRDNIAERVQATHTAVVIDDLRVFPPVAQKFLRENFLSIGRLRVAGKMLASPASAVGNIVSIAMPAEYVMVTRTGPVPGVLDGESVDGPRWLSAGEHRYELVDAGRPVALVWATAIERGFTPFPPRARQDQGTP